MKKSAPWILVPSIFLLSLLLYHNRSKWLNQNSEPPHTAPLRASRTQTETIGGEATNNTKTTVAIDEMTTSITDIKTIFSCIPYKEKAIANLSEKEKDELIRISWECRKKIYIALAQYMTVDKSHNGVTVIESQLPAALADQYERDYFNEISNKLGPDVLAAANEEYVRKFISVSLGYWGRDRLTLGVKTPIEVGQYKPVQFELSYGDHPTSSATGVYPRFKFEQLYGQLGTVALY